MNKILVTCASHSGSTQEVAKFIGEELSAQGLLVDVKPASAITDISAYDVIIVGGMLYRFGLHPDAINFLKKNLETLKTKKVALFICGLHLVKTPDCDRAIYPVFIDPAILQTTGEEQKKGLLDSITTMKGYLGSVLPTIDNLKPASLAFFAGKLNLNTLGVPEKLIMLFLMVLTGVKSKDYRNWEAIKEWVNSLGLKEKK